MSLKRAFFRLLGRQPEAVVVCFATGDPERSRRMVEEIRRLVPDREIHVVETGTYVELRRRFRRLRIGLAPTLFDGDPAHRALRRTAFLLAPAKILAYNARGERHHLRARTLVASWLFLRGVPLDRIFLRPGWLYPFKRDRTMTPDAVREFEGRPPAAGRPRVAVLSPYFPYPLSHGGAVRIFHLLLEMSREADVWLLAFTETDGEVELAPVLQICARVTLVAKPRYREPSWSTLDPPEVAEYRSPAMRRALEETRRRDSIALVQIEYAQLAGYGGDVLVEHDVTFDLYSQVHERERTVASWWNLWRWRRWEKRAVGRFRRVVAMSSKDAAALEALGATVVRIGNGVALQRFQPTPEPAARRLLFVGSFRHFPNAVAWRFFRDQVWPIAARRLPDLSVTVVAGPDPRLYWPVEWGALESSARVHVEGFVRDIVPLYRDVNIVVVPTLVSAGTNLKVLEALAAGRAVVSTSSGCAGLGLEHGRTVWIAESAKAFAEAIAELMAHPERRQALARAGRAHVERCYGWDRIGALQREMIRELTGEPVEIRRARTEDLEAVRAIQAESEQAAQWDPGSYLDHDCRVAIARSTLAGFIVARWAASDEREILNVAVQRGFRRQGVARRLLRHLLDGSTGTVFLEVRESNDAARKLYGKLGFVEVGVRPGYYQNPPEAAIVMRWQSC